jgi:hypothetical protein
MDSQPHRNYQNLPKIGPVYSSKDEKQRHIVDEILKYRIKPEMRLNINMNIPGLERKKTITPLNPQTRRLFAPLSCKGREGFLYFWTMPNISRFFPPFICVALLYYVGEMLVSATYYDLEHNNYEKETIYMKFQNNPSYYMDRYSLMA